VRKPRTRPLPTTLEAAREEAAKLEHRMRADKARLEQLAEVLHSLHSSAGMIPAVGSRWIRTVDMSRYGPSMRGRVSKTSYEMVAYAHPELGSPVLVLLGDYGDSRQHCTVSLATFYREFDPAPAAATKARKRA
jgi:hypothetical protein